MWLSDTQAVYQAKLPSPDKISYIYDYNTQLISEVCCRRWHIQDTAMVQVQASTCLLGFVDLCSKNARFSRLLESLVFFPFISKALEIKAERQKVLDTENPGSLVYWGFKANNVYTSIVLTEIQ